MVEQGLRVDEEMVTKGYEAAILIGSNDQGDSTTYLGGETGKSVVEMLNGP